MKKSIWKRLSSCESRINHLESDFSMNFVDYSYMKLRMERIIREEVKRQILEPILVTCQEIEDMSNGKIKIVEERRNER